MLARLQIRLPGVSSCPTVQTAGRTELSATATTAAFIPRAQSIPAPPGETTKRGWDFKALGGAGRGCVCVQGWGWGGFDTLHPAPCAVVLDQLTFRVIVISEH